MTVTKLSPCRACCQRPPTNTCPCFEGTIPNAGATLVIADFVQIDPFFDMNDTYTPIVVGGCGESVTETIFDVILISIKSVGIRFTRNNFVTIQPGGEPQALPNGEKAIFEVFQQGQNIPFSTARAKSWASFYKVLPDPVDGFVDCSPTISGFTFLGQEDNEFGPTFDASGGTVSYQ